MLDSIRRDGADRPYQINVGLSLLGMSLAEDAKDPSGVALWASTVARLYGNTGLYTEAFNYGLVSLENARKANSLKNEVQALSRLARTQRDLMNFEEAVIYAEKAIEKARGLPDSIAENRGWAFNMAGEINRLSGKYEDALPYYESAYLEFEKQDFLAGMEAVTHNKGLTMAQLGEYEQARDLLNIEMRSYIAVDPVRKLEYLLGMSEILAGSDSVEKALATAQEGIQFADSIDNLRWKINFLNRMAFLEKNRQNWEQAWVYREEAIDISEQVLGEKVRRQSEILDVRFDLNKLENQNSLLIEQNRNQELYTKGMAAIIILILVIASILIYNFAKTRRYTKELAQRNSQLDTLIQEKDVLMNIMAHDLKAPLHAIGGMMELISDPETPQQVRDVCIEKVNMALKRGTNLISNLLEMAALESGEIGVNLSETSLQGVMEEVIEDNSAHAERKGIEIKMDPVGEVEVRTDPVLLGRILNNFVSNAIKYSPTGKSVYMRLSEKENDVLIQVKDEGPGLTKEDQSKLFKKFKTLSAKPTAGENSTGLGLALSWALAEKINGEILVESEKNSGAVFSLRIPKAS